MAKKKPVVYSVYPAVAYCQAIIDNMPEKTGRSLPEWMQLVRQANTEGVKEAKAWLKSEHKLGGTTAGIIAERAHGVNEELTDGDAYLKTAVQNVETMYSGGKAHLRPIHDALIALGTALGRDVKVCPCKTIVPLYRSHVFAEIKPATKTRIDLGLALRQYTKKLPKRLIDTSGLAKNDRITHRIPLASVAEIDAEVERWLKTAYDLDA